MPRENVPNPVVLVIDDEALIRWSLSEALAEFGYEVRQASSAVEADGRARALRADPLVVLLDLRLPDVSDLSLLRTIRAARPDAPVVMMTAHGAPTQAAEAVSLGAVRFVGKPFDVGEMVRFVGEAWGNRQTA